MTENNEHLYSRIGTFAVTKSNLRFLNELFSWLLDPTHFPEAAAAKGRSRMARKYRAYELLLKKLMRFEVSFPEDRAQLSHISACLKSMLGKMKEDGRLVRYRARDGSNTWYVRKGPRPAVAPRLLLAACIAKALWPGKSSFESVVEQLRTKRYHMEKTAVERQVKRLLADPGKHVIIVSDCDYTPVLTLLRQELLDFKIWKEDQRSSASDMSIEEFDAQFQDYLDRIHPTAKQVELLRLMLDNFNDTHKHKGTIS